jgi:CheY-like chemotaxis protein
VAADAARRQAPPRPEAAPRRGGRILVVDDNRDAADSLAKLLRAWGHEVWTAYDGLQAIDVAREKRPLVALVDIALPKIDGYQVAQRLSRDPWGRTMTLIAVTGMGRDDDKERALAAGFDEHLTKPIDYDALRQILAPL